MNDLVQGHFKSFISSFPVTVSGFLGKQAAKQAKNLCEGT